MDAFISIFGLRIGPCCKRPASRPPKSKIHAFAPPAICQIGTHIAVKLAPRAASAPWFAFVNDMRVDEEQIVKIQHNLQSVRAQIEQAAEKVGRQASEIDIITVTKAQPQERVRAAYAAGIRAFGENRVEEALPKMEALSDLSEAKWHMVGHIQSRKAKLIDQRFAMVHSVDRMKIARKLEGIGLPKLPVLLECNLSGEASKWGWDASDPQSWPELLRDFAAILSLDSLQVLGFMTMAPMTDEERVIRDTFAKCRRLRDYVDAELGVNLRELSMGMSADFEIAVEEGATLLRIGTAIMGPRHFMG